MILQLMRRLGYSRIDDHRKGISYQVTPANSFITPYDNCPQLLKPLGAHRDTGTRQSCGGYNEDLIPFSLGPIQGYIGFLENGNGKPIWIGVETGINSPFLNFPTIPPWYVLWTP